MRNLLASGKRKLVTFWQWLSAVMQKKSGQLFTFVGVFTTVFNTAVSLGVISSNPIAMVVAVGLVVLLVLLLVLTLVSAEEEVDKKVVLGPDGDVIGETPA